MRVDQPPSVEGTGLRLRQIQLGDLDAWYAYLSIPEAVLHTSWELKSSIDLLPLLGWYTATTPDTPLRLAILEGEQENFIGTIGLHTRSPRNHSAELAFDLHPSHWGRGIMPRCVRAIMSWSFQSLGLVRLQATTLDENTASRRVLEKCGFRVEGMLRNYRMVRGVPRDFWMFATVPADQPGA